MYDDDRVKNSGVCESVYSICLFLIGIPADLTIADKIGPKKQKKEVSMYFKLLL